MSIAHSSHIDRELHSETTLATNEQVNISQHEICLKYQATPGREPLLQHEITDRPWAKLGVDLCDLNSCTLLVKLRISTRQHHKSVQGFESTRYEVSEVLISNNRPHFSAAEFSEFATNWTFSHMTSTHSLMGKLKML